MTSRQVVPFVLLFLALGLSAAQWQSVRQGNASSVDNAISHLTTPLEAWLHPRAQAVSNAETDALRRQVAALQADNARLQALLNLAQASPGRALAARVVARDPSGWFSSLTLDVGRRDGVMRDQVVVCPTGVLGAIVYVNDVSSRVRLLTDSHSAVPCAAGAGHALGVLYGTDGPTCALRYVDPDAVLKVHDSVTTSGMGSHFPANLVVGEVVEAGGLENGLFKAAKVRPLADLGATTEVLVLLQ